MNSGLLLAMCLVQMPMASGTGSAAATPNELSKAEAADGWLLLFDGKSLFGWMGSGNRWKASDGTLMCRERGGGRIQTTTEFADFILRLQFRRVAEARGTISFRAKQTTPATSSGYELRIDDRDPNVPAGGIRGVASTGLADAKSRVAPDAWHELEVRAEGERLTVRLDGTRVVDTRDTKYARGSVAITSEPGPPVEFRDIRLKPLLLKPIFNGKDLTGWWLLPNTSCRAEVKDGALHLHYGKGQIETEGQWKDFVLQLEIRTGARYTNSGVFFRGEPRQRWNGYEAQIYNKWLDDDRSKPDDYGTGAIYNRQAARGVYADDLEWFTMTVVAHGNHLATWVNGRPAADFTDNRPPNKNGRYGQKTGAGVISLQGHDLMGSIFFRNIRVAEFPKNGPQQGKE
jgi:hypothetical protein